MSIVRKHVERTFTVPEAAAILEQAQKQISNAVDRELAPLKLAKGGVGSRTITSAGLLALELLRAVGNLFSTEGRRRLLSAAKSTSSDEIKVQGGSLVLKLAEHRERVEKRKSRFAAAEALIIRDPKVLGGEPCVKGTRIPAYLVGALARKYGAVEAHATYPSVSRQTIELVALYVEANPRKGRPRQAELSKPQGPARRGKAKKIKLG
jgi:uncharacterized protein (DUF433 family)